MDAAITATYLATNTNLAVRYTDVVSKSFKRFVGEIPKTASNLYSGTVRIPYPPDVAPSPDAGENVEICHVAK